MKVGTEVRLPVVTRNVSRAYYAALCAVAAVVLGSAALLPVNVSLGVAHASSPLQAWWPTEGVRLEGTQPFKAMYEGLPVESYEMFWQVDGGGWNWMDNNYQDYPHKEASVDLSGWNWRGTGPYKVNFIARKDGRIIGESAVTIYTGSTPAVETQPALSAAPAEATPVYVEPAPASPVASSAFYVDPNSSAAAQARAWRQSRPADAAKMDVLAAQSTAKWLGGWSGNVYEAARNTIAAASAEGKTAVFVAYNIPGRDCGGYSAGGTDDYTRWIGDVARGIGNGKAVVILEPDALASISCLSSRDQQKRYDLLAGAVSVLKSNPNTTVYIDAGHPHWNSVSEMAAKLKKANVGRADGFALNVSNFISTGENVSYGTELARQVGKHFVIDTSRNGSGSNGEWCNPWGRTIGERPTTQTGNGEVDAYLWIKTPGESDGWCNGGPAAGAWWPDYALRLVP